MNTFDALCHRLSAHIDRRGWAHATCPECGKEARRGQSHFSFNEQYGHCFVCGLTIGIEKLAQQHDLGNVAPVAPRRQEPPKPRHWQSDPERYLNDYCAALDRVQAWTAYKPLSLESINRWRLGVGVLPSSQCQHRRLVYPLIVGGKIVGFRGRAIHCDCPKWLTAGGSQTICFGLDQVRPGQVVIITESPITAIRMIEDDSERAYSAIASTAGVATWRDEWTEALVARQPEYVMVWFDNDLAGCPHPTTRRRLHEAWKQKHPGTKPPEPNGPKIANRLLAAGLSAFIYHWPEGTPDKADYDWAIDQMDVAA